MVADEDERFKIEGDPENALRGLLKTSGEKEPARQKICPDCMGDGFSTDPGADSADPCKTCGGSGVVPVTHTP